MARIVEDGGRIGVANEEFAPLVDGVGFAPHRVDAVDTGKTRELLGGSPATRACPASPGWRDPDIDYILILCDTPAPTGGESMVSDGIPARRANTRRRSGALRVPDHRRRRDRSGDRETARVARMVEWTRGGRMVVRSDPWCRPRPRDPLADEHERLLPRYADLLAAAGRDSRARQLPLPARRR